jgi:ATP-binding cassette subfamily B protein
MQQERISFSVKEGVSILFQLISFAKPYWFRFSIALLGTIGTSVINAYLPIVIQQYIDEYLAMSIYSWEITIRIALFYLSLVLSNIVIMYVKDYVFMVASEKTVANLRNQVYKKVVQLKMQFFDQVPTGSTVSRVTNDTEMIKRFWLVILIVIEGLFNAVAVGVAMFALDVTLASLFMGLIPVIFILIYIYQKYSTIIYSRMREALAKLNANLNESISGMRTTQHFKQEERKKEQFDDVNQEYVTSRIKMFKMNGLLLSSAVNVLESVALAVALLIFGNEFLQGVAINVGILYAFTSYVSQFLQPVSSILNSLTIFQDGIVSGSRVLELLHRDDLAPSSVANAQGSVTEGKVEIKNVTFSYDNQTDVLKDINIAANPGETIALVGQTGSGKSSIINLLMRFYEFNQGTILIDDQPIEHIPTGRLREEMGLVLQDSVLFYGNIKSNIALHGDYTEQDVKQAAQFVNANHFIENLEGGFDAEVIEGGADFSTGEKQLLSFARTILRNPKILILDEATSNIDTETEEAIQAGLSQMRKGRTTFIIAHRLSTIKDADRIYVLQNGQIIEKGNHEELIDSQGVYYNMYQVQAVQE